MRKIAIIGSGGSGKSTLARRLNEILNIDVFHLDAHFWRPGWIIAKREEQITAQRELMKNDSWIIDGNYQSTMDLRLKAADTIIFLDMPKTLCIYRVFKRWWMYRKKKRPDMGDGCAERLDVNFLKFVWNFQKKKKPEILRKLELYKKEKDIIILDSPKAVKLFLVAQCVEDRSKVSGKTPS
ncbi:DNA topology modulation protein [Bacillus shivajii]|uniref:DNA topology modulation protein n=1 Tax=Bacillus shivajii TaxID=1983719 RepID=UPI001CFAD4E5|nr:DNA topology modulation protein [Bacillus shivajii]UCZ52198.1 DNA topology modulation protein [Bacillus shivajii]